MAPAAERVRATAGRVGGVSPGRTFGPVVGTDGLGARDDMGADDVGVDDVGVDGTSEVTDREAAGELGVVPALLAQAASIASAPTDTAAPTCLIPPLRTGTSCQVVVGSRIYPQPAPSGQ
jgi:hypothetical protein